MPQLASPSYAAGGLSLYSGCKARPSWWPAVVGQWVSIAGSALAGSPGVATPPISPPGGNGPQSRINSWNSLNMKRAGSEVHLACTGGHTDYPGNECSSIALDADAPAWRLRRTYTPYAQVQGCLSGTTGPFYNLDGTPISRHTFFASQYIDATDRVMLFGGGGLWQNGLGSQKTDGWNAATNTYDPAGTYPDAPTPASGGNTGQACVKHPITEDVYTIPNGGYKVDRWNRLTNTWTRLSGTSAVAHPSFQSGAIDPIRNQLFCFTTPASPAGVFQAGVWDLNTGARTAITFNASAAATALMGVSAYYGALVYSRTLGVYLFYNGQAGLEGVVYQITPNSGTAWDVSVFPTSGVTPATVPATGVNQRFIEAPELQGVFLLANYAANFNFFRTT